MSIRSHPRKRRNMLSGRPPSIRSGPTKRGNKIIAMPRIINLSKDAKKPLALLHVGGPKSWMFVGAVQRVLLSCIYSTRDFGEL